VARKAGVYAAVMPHMESFWKLAHLSDAQLLQSLGGVLRSHRRGLAELVAHLGEVEDRRLHLEAAHGSMFSYCVARLGMSEDEACRRIELARLARKFPALFAELESGRLTLSVALVLKPVLSLSNHLELLAAARGKCVRQARELVAERCPQPDARSSIRKLPERGPMQLCKPVEVCSPEQFSAARPLVASVAAPSAPTSSVPMTATADGKGRPPDNEIADGKAAVTEPAPVRSELTVSPAVESQARSAPRAGSSPSGSRMSLSRCRRNVTESSLRPILCSNNSSSRRATCCAMRTPAATSALSSRGL
jgi:hypothetical protein